MSPYSNTEYGGEHRFHAQRTFAEKACSTMLNESHDTLRSYNAPTICRSTPPKTSLKGLQA